MEHRPAGIAPLPPALLGQLRAVLGERLCIDLPSLEARSRDVSHHGPCPPQAVARVQSEEEVVEVVRACARHRVPLIPFGTGTAVEGGIVAVRGGVCLDLGGMDRIVEVNPADLDATVQAGVTRKALNRHLEELGTELFFPVDPGADASLGGMAATRASGSAAVRYGTMRENVLGLRAVLGDGRVIRTGGRARKSAAGYDLTRLLVGSEGTLGVITEVTLRLARNPAAISAAVCAFEDLESAVAAVIEVMGQGIPMARIELLDEVQIEAVNRYSGLDCPVKPTLFFEFHGSATSVEEQARAVGQIARRHGGADFQWAHTPQERQRLWQARHDAYLACLALRPGAAGYVTDVCVPISRLAEALALAQEELRSSPLTGVILGHVGDGNFHLVFPLDPQAPAELAEARRINQRLVDCALALGGTCSGEHGVGLGKIAALEQEAGEGVAVMRTIKEALDPHHIMNPGKVLRG
ncbi:MAG: FAD-binding protein [Candidatus Latescibacteria bacterium]|nr:FAD-binding protein [Candidatus Latescibacterota bacterium]